ncbi:MAG: hypothetical protein HGA45_15100 [Chloroflexales bacterium]|nr:hypothetical protein [Chloroflexales bacterium]
MGEAGDLPVGVAPAQASSSRSSAAAKVGSTHDYTPVAYKRAYCARIPRGELVVIAGSRHLTPLDRPAALNAAILRFLAGRGGAAVA